MAFRIMWNNLFDSATLAASTEASGFPATNLQHSTYLKAWRSTAVSATTLDANLGAAQDIKAFFAYYNNLQVYGAGGTADFHIQADDDSGYGSLGVNDQIKVTAAMVTSGMIGKFWATAQSFRYWRELIVDAAPNTYIRQGRIFLGDYFQTTYNASASSPDTQDIDPSTVLVSANGQKQANVLTKYRRLIYRWNALPASDIATLKTIYAAVGVNKPYFICDDETDIASATYYVRNTGAWVYTPVEGLTDYYSVQIEVETER